MVAIDLLVRGTVIHTPSFSSLAVLENAVLGVHDGRVAFCEDAHTEVIDPGGFVTLRTGAHFDLADACVIRELPPRGFVVPGLIDTHTHAPQFKFAGTGYDMQLLDWLTTYTFPSEAKWSDLQHAARVCHNAVRRTLRHGTTSCLWFATIHTDAAVQLGRIAAGLGQRAFVGKVNMDRNAPPTYCEASAAESLAETERFVKLVLGDAAAGGRGADAAADGVCVDCAPLGPPPQPVITPRFVPTCTAELMAGLGALAKEHNLLVTSHVSENEGEIAWVKELHPEAPSYTAVYDMMGLLTDKTILAHGVYLRQDERALFKARGAAVSHCPLSNLQLRSGMLNVRRCLEEGVAVALGTDVSGGAAPSMLSAVREALKVSNMVSLAERRPPQRFGEHEGKPYEPLSYAEAFWLATVGGARALGVEHLTGDFGDGAAFDAVVVDPDASGSPIDLYEGEPPLEAFQKWIQLGDDRNTAGGYVNGVSVL